MSIYNLDYLFKPRSLALVGASKREGSVGQVLARNLFSGGFEGPILPVNPKHSAIEGVLTYKKVADLPQVPDLAIISTPPDQVASVARDLAERGCKAAVVITAGFGEGGDKDGKERKDRLLSAVRPHGLRIVGPNCVGVLVPAMGLNASFSHIPAKKGDLAFVTQSGAMATSILDWAEPRGIGFSKVVSLGDKLDVDFGDLLDYLGRDPETRAILLYVEALGAARKFMSAARAAARIKPVIVIKGGRFQESAAAAASHTGAMVGSDAVYDAVFRRAGMLRVRDLDELFDAAETLSSAQAVRDDHLSILTNGGGLGVLAVDALIEGGGRLATLSGETMARLNACLPPTWSKGNPVDIIGDAPGQRYRDALEALLEDEGSDAILVMNCPTGIASSGEAARAVIDTIPIRNGKPRPAKPVFTAWLGGATAAKAKDAFHAAGLPGYETPERAVRAFLHLVRYRRNQELLLETPPSLPQDFEPDKARAEQIVFDALDERREWLTEPEAKSLMEAYGIPVVETRVADTPERAALTADAVGYPVAIKILSPDITHKTDVGGVELFLDKPSAVKEAAERMLARIKAARPDARITGFTIQRMIDASKAHELILGVSTDAQFGPVILFGAGGTAVEVLQDKALALPPLNRMLARRLMAETRVHRLLEGYRGRAPAALDKVADSLVRLAQLVADLPQICEVDINPLLVDEKRVIALDARVHIQRSTLRAGANLAIRPYPKELEQRVTTSQGLTTFLRPIRPEDEPLLRSTFQKLSPEDIRMRFFAPLRELNHPMAARLTQIDYDREMALVALSGEGREAEGYGVVRVSLDPDGQRGEYAVIVRSDLKGKGLGHCLMEEIIAYCRARRVREIYGDVLAENQPMLNLLSDLGFEAEHDAHDPGVLRVTKRLM